MVKKISRVLAKVVVFALAFTFVAAVFAAMFARQMTLIHGMPSWIGAISVGVAIVILFTMVFREAETSSAIDGGPGMLFGPLIVAASLGMMLSVSIFFVFQLIIIIRSG